MNNGGNKNETKVPVKSSLPAWYQRWHQQDHHTLIHWVIFLLIVCLFWIVLNTQITEWFATATNQVVFLNSAKKTVTLSIEPSVKTVKAGETFSVDIILDTVNKPVDGVDLLSLRYDPSILKVVDDDANTKGVQIQPGKLMELNSGNIVVEDLKENTGMIKFSQVSAGGTSYTGKGTVATVHFKAVAAGSTNLALDFTRGKTNDSNAAYRGKDQLASVEGSQITVEK